jgi:glycosyltransferase involved in cell wall biosynthesis
VPQQQRPRIVVVSPPEGAPSETFIRAHIERLPFDVVPHYGSHWHFNGAAGSQCWVGGKWGAAAATRLPARLKSGLFALLLARHLRRIGADAVLAEYGTSGAYLVDGCKRANIPLFVHFHGYDASVRTVIEEHREAYKRMFEYATGVVAVSKAMKERLLGLGAVPERLHVNPYGVDPQLFSGANPGSSPQVFVAVGRLVEKKAPHLTILAFSRIRRFVPEARLVVVGDGPLYGPCKRLAQALQLGSSVELLGVCGPQRVSQLMRSARAFVQHSLEAEDGDSEGTPVSILEAQMSGLPVVATRHGGIPDVVIERETGLLVDEADVEGMSAHILQLAREPALASQMGEAARERALAHYGLDRHLAQLAAMISPTAR